MMHTHLLDAFTGTSVAAASGVVDGGGAIVRTAEAEEEVPFSASMVKRVISQKLNMLRLVFH
jgi:hypothetical protein